MIQIDLTGNISDHMIRYAICRTVAEKNGYQWGINPVASHDYFGGREQMYFFEDVDYGIPINTPYGQLPEGVTNIWEEKREFHNDYAYHPFQPDIFDIPDNTKIVVYCGQDARYFDIEKIKKWFAIANNFEVQSKEYFDSIKLNLDENLCVVNSRGGEYRGIDSLFLTKNYWNNAFQQMLKINPKMKFICITEDPLFYRNYFDFPIYHFGILYDYYVVHNAKNLILSNSGFGLFPTWTSDKVENVIAPWGWARHNLGIWANSEITTFGNSGNCHWKWLDREGRLYDNL